MVSWASGLFQSCELMATQARGQGLGGKAGRGHQWEQQENHHEYMAKAAKLVNSDFSDGLWGRWVDSWQTVHMSDLCLRLGEAPQFVCCHTADASWSDISVFKAQCVSHRGDYRKERPLSLSLMVRQEVGSRRAVVMEGRMGILPEEPQIYLRPQGHNRRLDRYA